MELHVEFLPANGRRLATWANTEIANTTRKERLS
jgi:hypothetical protein